MDFLDYLDEEVKHTYHPDNDKSNFKIKDIFNDHWYAFLEDNPNLNIRPVVYEEVEKMMGCGSLSNGYSVYTCDHCHNYLYVPFTCKSRFCCSCGTKSTLDRANTISKKSINCAHRHMTFTIHKDLWPIYVIRYSGKPAMAQSRILDYDGEFVTFWYNRHEDNQYVTEKVHAYDFIKRLSIFMINILMLLDITVFMPKNINSLINSAICLSLMLQNLENNLKIGDLVLNYISNMTLLNVLVDILFTLTILFKSRIILLKR